jgi:hypothetical protein
MIIITVSSKKPPSCEIGRTGAVEHFDSKRILRGNGLIVHINDELASWQSSHVEADIKIF